MDLGTVPAAFVFELDLAEHGGSPVADAPNVRGWSGTSDCRGPRRTLALGTAGVGEYSESYRLTAQVDDMTGVGTYTFSGSTTVMTASSPPGTPTAAWSTDAPGGNGSVHLTSASSGRILGTLTATLPAVYGSATGSLTISAEFDIGSS
jgi:hypothetical protein